MSNTNTKKCNIALVYNIHNRHEQWQFITDILPEAKAKGYGKLVLEVPYKETFKDIKNIAKLIKENPGQELKSLVLKGLTKGIHAKESIEAVVAIKNIYSEHFEHTLKIVNDKTSENPGVDQYIEIGNKVLYFPIKFSGIEALNEEEQNLVVNEIKQTAITIIKSGSESGSNYASLVIEGLLEKFKVLGMDVADDKQCNQADIACRDQFMAKKLVDYCAKSGGDIIATVGLSHFGISDILRGVEQVTLKQFYPTSYAASDNQSHDNMMLRKDVIIIDTRDTNAIDIFQEHIGNIAKHDGEL